MNCCSFIGWVSKEPTTQRYPFDTSIVPVSYFDMAVERPFKSKQTADFLEFKAIGKIAESIEKYVHKGDRLGITAWSSLLTCGKVFSKILFV